MNFPSQWETWTSEETAIAEDPSGRVVYEQYVEEECGIAAVLQERFWRTSFDWQPHFVLVP